MKREEGSDRRFIESKERNQKMASILTFLITITNKVDQTLCRFKPLKKKYVDSHLFHFRLNKFSKPLISRARVT
jgi:hypothetical protein